MVNIKIEHLSDSFMCETCGYSWAEGANIYFDGDLVKELIPVAHCFDGNHYEIEDIYRAILEGLGHTLETNGDY